MSIEKEFAAQKLENREIIEHLIQDGSDPKADYQIEHHLSSANFDMLEKAAVDAFKLGFEVGDPEELELDDGAIILSFDATCEHPLDVDRLDKDCEALLKLADKHQIQYDGWGTYFVEQAGEEGQGNE